MSHVAIIFNPWSHVTRSDYVTCMSILRNNHVALWNLMVEGHTYRRGDREAGSRPVGVCDLKLHYPPT